MGLSRLFDWWKNTALDEELQSMETELARILVPLEPNPQFVMGLRHSLVRQIKSVKLAPAGSQNKTLPTGLLVTGGVLGGVVVVLASIRGLVSLLGVASLIVNWMRQETQDSLTTSNLVQ